jgi:response regulator of citrate/malate metabolism
LPPKDRIRIYAGRQRIAEKRRRQREQHLIAIAEVLRENPDAWKDADLIAQEVGISRRSYFRYINLMRQRGFCPACGRLVAGIDEGEDAG